MTALLTERKNRLAKHTTKKDIDDISADGENEGARDTVPHSHRKQVLKMNYTLQELPAAGSTVLVGMSGGVDSTLAALLLQEKGCRVIGVTMSLWDAEFLWHKEVAKASRESCFSPGEEENFAACEKFCADHGIEYHVVDVKKQYKEKVLEYVKREYRAGRTPNPCVMCNRNVKFGALLEGAAALGVAYDYFCTGHYANVVRPDAGLFGTDARPYMIQTASDALKDQTYFLHRVPSSVLEKVRFPLGAMKKSEVFALARERNLAAAEQSESQDFIAPEYFDALFADKLGAPGDIVDLDGRVLGTHKGIEHYTVGQRRGLGVAVSYPVYVHSIDAATNSIVLAPEDALYSGSLVADDFVWAGGIEPKEPFEAMVKIRLASRPVKCTVTRAGGCGAGGAVMCAGNGDDRAGTSDGGAANAGHEAEGGDRSAEHSGHGAGQSWRIEFAEPQKAVAPGQSAVLYDGGVILGGGIIRESVGARP